MKKRESSSVKDRPAHRAVDGVAGCETSTRSVYASPGWEKLRRLVLNAREASPGASEHALVEHIRRVAPEELEALCQAARLRPEALVGVLITRPCPLEVLRVQPAVAPAPKGRLVGFDRGLLATGGPRT